MMVITDIIDPCGTGINNCHKDARCIINYNNLSGSTCICGPGFTGNGTHCDGNFLFIFLFIFPFINVIIADIDECANNSHDCYDKKTHCVNVPGTYKCGCKEGYILDDKKGACHGTLLSFYYY